MEALEAFGKHHHKWAWWFRSDPHGLPIDESQVPVEYTPNKDKVDRVLQALIDLEPPKLRVHSPITLITNWHIGVKAIERADSAVKVSIQLLEGPSASESKSMYRYQIFPKWKETYMRYLSAPFSGNPVDTDVVEKREIEQRYPDLYPFWSDWVKRREAIFRKHHGETTIDETDMSRSEVVAWEITGFLMGIWMAFQPDVDQLTFQASETDKPYLLKRAKMVSGVLETGTLEEQFEMFLRDKERQLKNE